MRLFFAFAFPERIKHIVAQNVSILRREIPKGIKWVEKENLHITFRFLGEVNPNILDDLSRQVKIISRTFYSFSISLGKLEIVPNLHRPRIIWYNMIENSDTANKIFYEVEKILKNFGFEKSNRPLKLHATLGRIKYSVNANWETIIKKIKPISETIMCKELTLFKSQLTASGPIYTVVQKFNFK
ncbi:MAG: RNA 2',3'-cyclic phosphodiesterase [Candidatus Cloacimonetes bacterium]|nr:RNA 2',3'-cyclic phosphodiesterase [Candidatus Cloacimonadota bacterium]MBL7085475.1 RNA 2',3'-cyclic phosphodiesterase [Candidatus Cloacimonadota bacterium]